jgi:hypothetical protein
MPVSKPESKPTEPPKPMTVNPMPPAPTGGTTIKADPKGGTTTVPMPPAPTGDLIPPMAEKPTPPPTPPTPIDGRDIVGKPNLKPVGASTQPDMGSPILPPPPSGSAPAIPPMLDVPPPPPPSTPPSTLLPPPVAETKFRIILRVGEGTPTFEVKNGDNLVLKVACEKVDIKSPEKGGGPSEVTARGKVRFAGFGAEGTCDELKFFTGTGEVNMTGEVKVQVKDKLGRVESELTTGSLKYKIDASVIGGQLKP